MRLAVQLPATKPLSCLQPTSPSSLFVLLLLFYFYVQIRALARLSWFFLLGTTAQLIAIGIVVYELLLHPDPEAKTEVVRISGHYERQFVAIFNMVFAYGGQFAFTGKQHSHHPA